MTFKNPNNCYWCDAGNPLGIFLEDIPPAFSIPAYPRLCEDCSEVYASIEGSG